jgi:hypothetical protein
MPGAVAQLDIACAGQQEASPFAGARKAAFALSGELKGQRGFVASLLVSQDDGAEFATVAAIAAHDLFALPDGLDKQRVGRTRHRLGDQAAAVTLAGSGLGLKVSATATEATPTVNEPR